jgi:signal transduction histidine kinase
MSRIAESGHKMNNVITELLLLASLRSGDIEVYPLNMEHIVNEAKKRLRYQILETNATIMMPDSWPTAVGHASWIEEAWLNYMSNGLKYGGEDPVIELGSDMDDDGMIRFWVKDNGEGLTELEQQRLFRPHTRLRPQRIRGEGLGLSIVNRIVKKCGGDVGVESQLDEGSIFWFTLPPLKGESG